MKNRRRSAVTKVSGAKRLSEWCLDHWLWHLTTRKEEEIWCRHMPIITSRPRKEMVISWNWKAPWLLTSHILNMERRLIRKLSKVGCTPEITRDILLEKLEAIVGKHKGPRVLMERTNIRQKKTIHRDTANSNCKHRIGSCYSNIKSKTRYWLKFNVTSVRIGRNNNLVVYQA